MHPTLVHLGPLTLHSYGLALAISFFLGILLATRRGATRGMHSDLVFDTSLVIVFASVIGARLMYVVFHWGDDLHSLVDVVSLWNGGLTMYGGVLAAMGAAWLYLRRRQVAFLRMADVVAPSLGLGLALTRVGCFLNGCCYGKPTHGPLGIVFPPDSLVHTSLGGVPIHPTQLYSSATGVVILVALLVFDRVRRADGQVFALYLLLDAAGRFVLDSWRYYEPNAYLWPGGPTVNQAICVGLFGLGLLLLARSRRAVVSGVPVTADPQARPAVMPEAR